MWDRKKHPDLVPSWALLFDPEQQPGPFLLLDEMRDQLGSALLHLGHDVNTTDKSALKAAADLLTATKTSAKCLGFEGGVGAKNKVAAGAADLAVVWNGDAVRAIEEEQAHDRLAYGVPREGSIIWVDVLTIPARAPHADLAHQFINFLLEAPVGASVSNFNKFATPNRAALPLIDQADRENLGLYPDATTMKTLVYLKDVGETTALYDEAWTAVKAR